MRKIREVLRLKWIAGSSARQIAKSCNIARSTVKEYLIRAEDAGLTWPKACKLDDTALWRTCSIPKAPQRPFPGRRCPQWTIFTARCAEKASRFSFCGMNTNRSIEYSCCHGQLAAQPASNHR